MVDGGSGDGAEGDWGYVSVRSQRWHAKLSCAGIFNDNEEMPLEEALDRGAIICNSCAEDRREERDMETREQYSGANY